MCAALPRAGVIVRKSANCPCRRGRTRRQWSAPGQFKGAVGISIDSEAETAFAE
jgi:hypothetical protein